jgi:hypothetical protein
VCVCVCVCVCVYVCVCGCVCVCVCGVEWSGWGFVRWLSPSSSKGTPTRESERRVSRRKKIRPENQIAVLRASKPDSNTHNTATLYHTVIRNSCSIMTTFVVASNNGVIKRRFACGDRCRGEFPSLRASQIIVGHSQFKTYIALCVVLCSLLLQWWKVRSKMCASNGVS